MNEDQHEVHAPNIEGEEMKLPETAPKKVTPPQHSTAPLNGIIIVIMALLLVFILGGLYMWFNQLMIQKNTPAVPAPAVERPVTEVNNEPEGATTQATIETQPELRTSDEIIAIEADIEATDLDSLDAELSAMDAELEAALNEEF